MKAKLIASVVTLTTLLGIGYPVAAKAMESEEQGNVNDESTENIKSNNEVEIVEGWSNDNYEMRYFKKNNAGVLCAVSNAYVEGYYLDENGIRTGDKTYEKVKNVSDAISLIKSNHKKYFGEENVTMYGKSERKDYKVQSVRDEFRLNGYYNMIDEPAYIVSFVGAESEIVYFTYAVGCYTEKVYMGISGVSKVNELKNNDFVADYGY